jgi:predicted nucleic acid-binding protein
MSYLFDSNVIIDYLAGRFTANKLTEIVDTSLNISVVTKIEVLGFISGIAELDSKTEQFVSLANNYELTSNIVQQTILLRKKYRLKMPDAIIAATALTHNFKLLSHNTKDFEMIVNLTVIDPYKL